MKIWFYSILYCDLVSIDFNELFSTKAHEIDKKNTDCFDLIYVRCMKIGATNQAKPLSFFNFSYLFNE